MTKAAFNILRVGVAVTFLWIGLLIFKDPVSWTGYIGDWAQDLMVLDAVAVMTLTGIFDMIIGLWLLLDYKVWIPASLATLHLASVIVVSGINSITVRDIGLLAASLALFFDSAPNSFLRAVKIQK